ncbi:MAG: ribosome maturation factor RimP [Bacillota bacterium]|jgi:ribosome maturation factor RimP
MNRQIGEKIEKALAGFEDIEVVDVRFGSSGGKGLVQVLVDKGGGISLDDLTKINRFLSKEMDAWDVASGAYMLEVSSAGLERPLTKLEHFARFSQRKAKIVLHEALADNRKKYTGIIQRVQGDIIHLETETGMAEIPYAKIKKANLVYELE